MHLIKAQYLSSFDGSVLMSCEHAYNIEACSIQSSSVGKLFFSFLYKHILSKYLVQNNEGLSLREV